MAERETVEKVKQRQGLFAKIQNFFTLGYGTKEDLRELDRKLRDGYYEDLRDLRHVWEDIYLAALEVGVTKGKRNLKKVLQVLDRVMEKVRHADYGYAGLIDRKGHIREEELARIFNYDRSLDVDIEYLKEMVNQLYGDTEAENWTELPNQVRKIKGLILAFEKKWHERENRFRPLDM
jgi:hypothetical protein